MEPREIKRLSVGLIAAGAVLALLGIALITSGNGILGICSAVFGIILILLGVPALSILSKYTYSRELDEERKNRNKGQ